jgi:adenine-specific DNA-methyltransferase
MLPEIEYAPKTATGDLIISVQALSPLQISIPEKKMETKIENLVDKIIYHKHIGTDTTELENQIDQLVYQLYGLTAEEIGIVEGTVK